MYRYVCVCVYMYICTGQHVPRFRTARVYILEANPSAARPTRFRSNKSICVVLVGAAERGGACRRRYRAVLAVDRGYHDLSPLLQL